jgi:hypothetical protein
MPVAREQHTSAARSQSTCKRTRDFYWSRPLQALVEARMHKAQFEISHACPSRMAEPRDAAIIKD